MIEINILYIAYYYPPLAGVAAVNTHEIVKRLARRKHFVTVYAPFFISGRMDRYEDNIDHVEVHRSLKVPLNLGFLVPTLYLKEMAKHDQFDVIISQYHPFHFASVAGFVKKAHSKKPWVIKVHDLVMDPTIPRSLVLKMYSYFQYHLQLYLLRKYGDKVLVMSNELRNFLINEEECSSDKIAVVPNGVDTTLFCPSKDDQGGSVKTILYTGSMFVEDGLNRLIRAFSLLEPKSQLRLLLVGNGPEKPKLQRIVTDMGLQDYVTFIEGVSHSLMPEVLKTCYLAIGPLYPSVENSLTIPTKILEYFACALPVVSCRVSSDILIDGVTGFVVSPPTYKNIAEKISILLEDESLRRRLAMKARDLVTEKFDWEVVADSFERELKAISLIGNWA